MFSFSTKYEVYKGRKPFQKHTSLQTDFIMKVAVIGFVLIVLVVNSLSSPVEEVQAEGKLILILLKFLQNYRKHIFCMPCFVGHSR